VAKNAVTTVANRRLRATRVRNKIVRLGVAISCRAERRGQRKK